MLFLVRTKSGMIMSQDLTWLDIKQLTAEDKYKLMSIPNQTANAQHLCKWFADSKNPVSPVTPKTVYSKWGVDLSMVNGNTFAQMLELKRCPEYLKRAPADKNQIKAFQTEWVKKRTDSVEKTENPNKPESKEEPDNASEPISVPAQKLNFHPATSIKQQSNLINEMVATFTAFGELMQKIPTMLSEKQKELVTIEKKLLDLRHIAELHDDLNAAEGYRFYKEQRDALRRRRVLKDEILALDTAINATAGITPADLSSFVHSIEGLDKRAYRPRAILESEVEEIIRNPKTADFILGRETIPVV